jgi:hypothetical protein
MKHQPSADIMTNAAKNSSLNYLEERKKTATKFQQSEPKPCDRFLLITLLKICFVKLHIRLRL